MKVQLPHTESQGLLLEIDAWLKRRHQAWLWLGVIVGAGMDLITNGVLGLAAVLSAIPVIGPVVSAIVVFLTSLDTVMLFGDEAIIAFFPSLCTLELLRRFKAWLRNS